MLELCRLVNSRIALVRKCGKEQSLKEAPIAQTETKKKDGRYRAKLFVLTCFSAVSHKDAMQLFWTQELDHNLSFRKKLVSVRSASEAAEDCLLFAVCGLGIQSLAVKEYHELAIYAKTKKEKKKEKHTPKLRATTSNSRKNAVAPKLDLGSEFTCGCRT